MSLTRSLISSPIGNLVIVADDRDRVRLLAVADRASAVRRLGAEQLGGENVTDGELSTSLRSRFVEYFAGNLRALEGIATDLRGSPLQQDVWRSLDDIPAGETTSYGAIAKRLGLMDPRAAIDVGAAVGANPVAIIKPCHRVIGSDGSLKGYAYGLHRKKWLLEHEGAFPQKSLRTETD